MIDSLLTSLKSFTSRGQLSEAFKIFSFVQSHVSSSEIPVQCLSSLLASCAELHSLEQGKQIHSHLIVSGFERNPGLVPKLVTFYATFNLLVEARVVTENSNVFHTLPWNLLIFAYVKNRLYGDAITTYKRMVSKGIRPDNFTYPAVIKACGENLDVGFGRELHVSITAGSQPWSLFVHNALVSMYIKFGLVEVARDLFDKMPERDAVSLNTMISAYASKALWKEAFEMFESVCSEDEVAEINIVTWNTIAGGFLRTGDFGQAIQLIPRMRSRGVELDSVALIICLGACSHLGAIKLGHEIHGYAIQRGFDGLDNFKNALITMYCRCGDLSRAGTVFRLIENKTVISWNSLLSGYAHMNRAEEASSLFREMLFSGINPSYVTIASTLPLCARVANLQHGKEFHGYILKRKDFAEYLILWNAIVDMYARSGRVREAEIVFNSLAEKNEVTYTSMIAGYGIQGKGLAAMKLFEEMTTLGIKPDHVTMVAVLSSCSHSGLVAQGRAAFERMTKCTLTPRLEHYSCMVDLFGRAGLICEAKNIITEMPFNPTPAMWAALIGACRVHGDMDTGEWAAERLLEMKPRHSGYYVLIANMYASAGRWDSLARIRTFMRDLGVKKDPGQAWVDVGNGFSSFVVGDVANLITREIYCLLAGLSDVMKDYEGYTCNAAIENVLEDYKK